MTTPRWAGRARRARSRWRRTVTWRRLRRVEPFSRRYGFDLGRPVDRHFIDAFFAAHASDVQGRLLEVADQDVSDRHGHHLEHRDVVDIDPENPCVTIVADLAEAGSLPADSYDCAIVPQTLQYVADPGAALANLWQSLRPGGVLLLTVPTIAKIDHHLHAIDRWRITPAGLTLLVETHCPGGDALIEPYGNLLAATTFLAGAPADAMSTRELAVTDPEYPVVCAARVVKPWVSS